MNKKGQNFTVAALIILFISVLVGLVLMPTVAQFIGDVTDDLTYNSSAGSAQVTFPADGVTIDLTGQAILNTPIIRNDSGTVIAGNAADGNWTIQDGISTTTGLKSIQMTGNGSEHAGETVNISYTYGPDGYIESAGGRSIAGLVTLFFALAIAIVAMTPTFRNKLFDLIGR